MKSVFVLLNLMLISASAFTQVSVSGSWSIQEGTMNTTWLFQDGYYSCTQYDVANKVFSYTKGGAYSIKGNELQMHLTFHTGQKEKIGTAETAKVEVKNETMQLTVNAKTEVYRKLDDGKSALAGHWLITGRMNNGTMQTITPGARRTIKLLTGTRFQWIAINSETKEFFGTGGGTYTFVNGKYTEHIEFFSRDSSRVGASLSFDGKVEGNNWHHSGLSSRGEPIHEIWTRGL